MQTLPPHRAKMFPWDNHTCCNHVIPFLLGYLCEGWIWIGAMTGRGPKTLFSNCASEITGPTLHGDVLRDQVWEEGLDSANTAATKPVCSQSQCAVLPVLIAAWFHPPCSPHPVPPFPTHPTSPANLLVSAGFLRIVVVMYRVICHAWGLCAAGDFFNDCYKNAIRMSYIAIRMFIH